MNPDRVLRVGDRLACCPHSEGESLGNTAVLLKSGAWVFRLKQPETVYGLDGTSLTADALVVCQDCLEKYRGRDWFRDSWVAVHSRFGGSTSALN